MCVHVERSGRCCLLWLVGCLCLKEIKQQQLCYAIDSKVKLIGSSSLPSLQISGTSSSSEMGAGTTVANGSAATVSQSSLRYWRI